MPTADRFVSLPFTSIMLLGITALGLSACGRGTPPAVTAGSTSVPDQLQRVPNLRSLDIATASYRITKTAASGGIPSPSDIRMELTGTVDLAGRSAETLQRDFEWKAVPRADVPARLLPTLPSGDCRVNAKLHATFAGNPTFTHGFVVVVANDWRRLYVLATDRDHPIR